MADDVPGGARIHSTVLRATLVGGGTRTSLCFSEMLVYTGDQQLLQPNIIAGAMEQGLIVNREMLLGLFLTLQD